MDPRAWLYRSDFQLLTVLERIERELRRRERVNRNRHTVLEPEAAVP